MAALESQPLLIQVEVYTHLGTHWNDDSKGKFPQVTTCQFENTCFITVLNSRILFNLKIKYAFRIFY
jgi:hypothetical protein